MDLILDHISKRYTTGWVLKDISKEIKSGHKIAITGSNGSGKSTLIQIIAGYLSYTKGKLTYNNKGQSVDRDNIFRHLAIAAAYMELDEELSPLEIYEHYQVFKPLTVDYKEFMSLTEFTSAEQNKQVRYFSSGMKQRLALGLAFVMDVPLLILDEPTSFLDKNRKVWYSELMNNFGKDKTIIIASNDAIDIQSCTDRIELN